MKSNRYLFGFMVLTFCACQKLNREIVTSLTEKQVTLSYDYTKNRVSAVYADLLDGLLYIDGAMMASASDEAEHTQEVSAIQKFNTGAWNAYDNPDDVWGKYYKAIRKANQFLLTSDSVNLDYLRLDQSSDAQAVYGTRLAEINRWKYEVRFLRAFYYFELVKRYGGVPLITQVFSLDDVSKDIKRNTLEDCVKFISDECDSAAVQLPAEYGADDLGRITKGAALALKSRMLLYAASDLFNTPSWSEGYANPELVSLTGDRLAKWTAAANAAKEVIDLGVYSLDNSYSHLFSPDNYNSSEVNFVRRNNSSNTFEMATFPIGYNLGRSGTTPSQNLVDDYEMKDGSSFNWNDPAIASAPYANRDPRLEYTVLTNNTGFLGRPVETWTGGLDAEPIAQATKTGYYLRKYVDESLDIQQGRMSVHSWIFIRLAEIYLNYAEALNESSPGNPDIALYLNMVRQRNGVALPALPAGLSQAEMRERIRHERRIELAFEDQRFWDVRRWMQAPQYLGAFLNGVKITKTGSTFSYERIVVENRVFQPKMYLYPIPQGELMINKDLLQNPLW